MQKCSLLLLAVLSLTTAARAQEPASFPNEPYEFILAKLAADEGRYDEALVRMDQILAKTPGDPVLLYERAMMLIEAGRVDRAEAELRRVVAAHPDFFDARRILGRLLLDRAGSDRARVDEALVHLQAAFKLNPDDLNTGSTLAQILVSLNRFIEAEGVLATLAERVPDQRSINYNYAQVLTKLGKAEEAQPFLERAVAVDPTYVPAILQLVELYQKSNAFAKAAEVIQPLVAEDEKNLELRRQQAYFYLRAGNAQKARDLFKALVAADPADERSRFYLAEALNDLEQYGDAGPIFQELIKTSPDPDYVASYGLAQVGMRKWDDAQKTFNGLLALPEVPDNLQALAKTQLAYIELQRGNYDAAVAAARPVLIFRERANPQAINIALDALSKQKKTADALALLQPLAEQFATDPYVAARYIEWLTRSGDKAKAAQFAATQAKHGVRNTVAAAEAYVQADDAKAAVALVRDALKTHAGDLDLQFQLGSLLERSGDRKAAEQQFLTILAKHPEHAPSLNYLGYMWAESNVNLERALDMLMRAVDQDPRNGAYVDSLGWVYFRLGKLDLAEQHLTDATQLLPRDATVHEHLADVIAKRGDMQRALQIYRQALAIDPDSKDGEKIRAKIAELERKQTTAR